MTITEIKSRIKEIDMLLDSDRISDEEFDRLQMEAVSLTAELGQLERLERLRSAKKIDNVNDWTRNFLSSFDIGNGKITNKQVEIFKKINHGKPFIYDGKRYDFSANYWKGFGFLTVGKVP